MNRWYRECSPRVRRARSSLQPYERAARSAFRRYGRVIHQAVARTLCPLHGFGMRALAVVAVAGMLTAMLAPADASAQPYPSKPIRIVMPFPVGGLGDTLARQVSARLSDRLRVPVVVENLAGASGVIGTQAVARSSPDGYTLLLSTIQTHGINSAVLKSLPYDPIKDFAGIIEIGNVTNVLVLNPAVPAKSVSELVAYAKANPGKLSYASAGMGSIHHLSAELFMAQTGVKMLHVPYRGIGTAFPDLLSGQVSLSFTALGGVTQFIKAGQLKALAVATTNRTDLMPDLPTVAQAGIGGFEANNWIALWAPAGTPREIIVKLNGELNDILSAPEAREKWQTLATEFTKNTPEQLDSYVRSEVAKWQRVARQAGIEPE